MFGMLNLNPSALSAPNWRWSVFDKKLREWLYYILNNVNMASRRLPIINNSQNVREITEKLGIKIFKQKYRSYLLSKIKVFKL